MLRYLLNRGSAHAARAPAVADVGTCRRSVGKTLTAAVLLGAASSTWALGLGDIELDSALNEKLDAEIELFDADGLQPTEILVSLASADDFERVGVERFFFLTDLRFEVAYGRDGVTHVQVTSTQPVTEPYLNFLVEVLWPSGRMLKEYTLLLDPPTFSRAPAPSVAAPSQSREQPSGGAGRVERQPPVADTGTRVQLAPGRGEESSPLDDGVVGDEYRMTDRADTLWSIAQRTRPSDAVTVHQNMLAIQRLNPDAFLNGNINLLKAGYTLRLPSEQQARSISGSEAIREVAMQNEDWRALRRGETPSRQAQPQQRVAAADQSGSDMRSPVDATTAAPRAQQTEQGPDGELRIVAGAGETAAGGTDPETAEALNAAAEERDRLGREVQSLTDELEREKELAGNQIAVKDRQLEVKDQQIAEMQAEMERLRQELAQQGAAQRQNQSASATQQPWWQSPYVMWGGGGVVVLLLVYGLIAARRRRGAEEEFYPELAEGAFDEAPAQPDRVTTATAAAGTAAPAAAAVTHEILDLDEDEEEPEAVDEAPAPNREETTGETSDVIGEADIYIAYGRYPQAIGLLLGVLEEDPNRNDVRLKLLELYAETRDRDAFDAHMAELVARCDDDEALLTARELAQQFGGDDELPPATAVPDITADDGAEDLSIDYAPPSLDDAGTSEAPSAEGEPSETERSASDELELVSDAAPEAPEGAEDFELELDDLAEEDPTARSARSGASDALGGDLGMDFDPDRDVDGNGEEIPADLEAEALSSGDDLDLDLDDDSLGEDAFDFGDEGDTAGTKLDLARAYIDMGDQDGARDILNEVVVEGNTDQQQRAQAMLEEL